MAQVVAAGAARVVLPSGVSPQPAHAVLATRLGRGYTVAVQHKLTAIVAMTPDRVIGQAGTLPWHLPEDLAFFKRMTLGHAVVMGRKTFESIGKPLPKRRNIVLTRDPAWHAPGVEVIHRPQDLELLPELGERVFIIGGAEIYEAFLPATTDLLVSHLSTPLPGDTYFPEFAAAFPHCEVVETHPDFDVRHWHRNPDEAAPTPAH